MCITPLFSYLKITLCHIAINFRPSLYMGYEACTKEIIFTNFPSQFLDISLKSYHISYIYIYIYLPNCSKFLDNYSTTLCLSLSLLYLSTRKNIQLGDFFYSKKKLIFLVFITLSHFYEQDKIFKEIKLGDNGNLRKNLRFLFFLFSFFFFFFFWYKMK